MSAAGAVHPPATRREKRRDRKKERRRQARRETAALARAAAAALAANPVEQRRLRELEEAEASASERARRAFEDAERRWLEAAAARAAAAAEQEEARKQSLLEASPLEKHKDDGDELGEGEEWEYVEEGPAEIIWQGNEIIVKKKKVKVPKKIKDKLPLQEDDRPTSNPLPPQTSSFASHMKESSLSAQEVLEKVAQETPNFGTEQDKAHCPFHLKTGACRFGVRCSRVHFYPDRSCTLLIKNMYNGPGLAFEQDEGLEFTDEEVEHSYEEFYEDVHTEFLKFGELVNFKVCRNGSSHLRGNVYVHYKSLDSALLAHNSMNGRYFAGKQLTCEFVAVTRWKAAICGEYMRTRLKTCSHGTACNFIHCFRNPGGDYEWADWDNAPPKYWIRKMTALFGPSDDAVFGKPSDVLDFERLRRSDRKLRSSDFERHDSRRSRNEVDAKKHHSLRDHYSEQYHGCHRTKSEHAQGRRELSAADRHQSHEVEDDAGKNSTSREYERGTDKHKHRERHRSDYGDDRTHRTQEYFDGKGDYRKSKSRKDRSDRQQSVESGLSDWPLDSTNRDVSKSPSSSKSSGRFSNCKKGYNGRQSSEDPDLERLYSTVHNSTGKEHAAKTQESLKHHAENYSSDDEKDGGRRRSRKHMTHTHKNHDDDSDDRWVATHSDADSDEEVQYRPSSSGSTKLGRKDEKSSRKRKHHSESRKHKESKEDTPDS